MPMADQAYRPAAVLTKFNKDLYLLAYGNIYSSQGAMTPGASGETADGMSEGKIEAIIELMRSERYRFAPARRIWIPKKNGKLRPLGLRPGPTSWSARWSASCLEAYYEPRFSGCSHGFRKGRGCHTALRDIQRTWTGAVWLIEGDISCGKGPSLAYGPAVHNKLLSLVQDTAEKNNIPVQMRAVSRSTGTDTDSFAYANDGCPSVLISIPLRYMHTTVEMLHKKDIEQTIRLMYETLLTLTPKTNLSYL